MKTKAFALVVLALCVIPMFALAAPNIWPLGFWGPLVSCTGNYLNGTGAPCQNLCDLVNTIINVLYFLISVCIFIVAPVSFAIGGIMIMVAGANPEMLSKGKHTITGTAVGILIVLSSYLIIATFLGVLNITGIGGFGSATCSI